MSLVLRTLSVVIVALLTIAALYGLSRARGVTEVKLDEDKPPVQAHPAGIIGQPLGSAGCMGAACHGAPAARALAGKIDGGTWQSSGSCWVAADPHAAAYSLLTDKPYRVVKVTAKHIMDRYAPGTKATADARCLACHTNPALAGRPIDDEARLVSLRAEGVSCEACHGNAGGWIRQHTTWNGKRDAVYDATGMVKLYNLGERALACAGCHIGSPEAALGKMPDGREVALAVRDMNHDMIAAGHPRLNFDFAEYQRRLPAHWQEKDRDNGNAPRGAELAVKAWLLGRVAHAEAACKLLESRAGRSEAGDPLTPWPEFAEYNCAACHHELVAEWRGKILDGRMPGAPPWQAVWPVTPAIGLTPHQPTELFAGAGAKPRVAVQKLVKVMEIGRLPGAAKVRPHAQDAAAALKALRVELSARPEAEFVREANAAFGELTPGARDWDSGLQVLFGLAALERSRPRDKTRDELFSNAFGAYRGAGGKESDRWTKMKQAIGELYPKR